MDKQHRWVLVVREPIKRPAKFSFVVQLLARTLPLDHPLPDGRSPHLNNALWRLNRVSSRAPLRGEGRPPSLGSCRRSPRSPPTRRATWPGTFPLNHGRLSLLPQFSRIFV